MIYYISKNADCIIMQQDNMYIVLKSDNFITGEVFASFDTTGLFEVTQDVALTLIEYLEG